ncbi:hypothetical protein [Actinomycetospora sp. CA-084318]|uniref:hypothetical protein n=1 Tax=Actinomycetospora sp. CA-084318 TaxID=3239892 RepID=UPI003D989222
MSARPPVEPPTVEAGSTETSSTETSSTEAGTTEAAPATTEVTERPTVREAARAARIRTRATGSGRGRRVAGTRPD